jgi:hypothetical protein
MTIRNMELSLSQMDEDFLNRWDDLTAGPHPSLTAVPEASAAESVSRDGTFWWARTTPYTIPQAPIGVSVERDSTIKIRGAIHETRYMHNAWDVGAKATFNLSPERRPFSASNTYLSTPAINLNGRIDMNGGGSIWGSPHVACYLYFIQTVFQANPSDPLNPVVLGTTNKRFDLHDNDVPPYRSWTAQDYWWPMQPVKCTLWDSNGALWVELKMQFNLQLSNTNGGNCSCTFDNGRDVTQPFVLRAPQWKVVAL